MQPFPACHNKFLHPSEAPTLPLESTVLEKTTPRIRGRNPRLQSLFHFAVAVPGLVPGAAGALEAMHFEVEKYSSWCQIQPWVSKEVYQAPDCPRPWKDMLSVTSVSKNILHYLVDLPLAGGLWCLQELALQNQPIALVLLLTASILHSPLFCSSTTTDHTDSFLLGSKFDPHFLLRPLVLLLDASLSQRCPHPLEAALPTSDTLSQRLQKLEPSRTNKQVDRSYRCIHSL